MIENPFKRPKEDPLVGTFRKEVIEKTRGKTKEELEEEARAYTESLKHPSPGKVKLTPEEKAAKQERGKRLRQLKEARRPGS